LDITENGYTALIKHVDDWWIGWVQECPGVNAQERTKDELLASLAQALREAIALNRADARKAADSDYSEPLKSRAMAHTIRIVVGPQYNRTKRCSA
jgi:predicted RNase H-like HicB family nuclease